MIHDDVIDPAIEREAQERRARILAGARQLVAAHEAGAQVDPYSLDWARQTLALGRPANGWLGDPLPRTPARICNPETR